MRLEAVRHPVLTSRAMTKPESAKLAQHVLSRVPYSRALGMQVVEATAAGLLVSMPARSELTGDSQRGWLHTGATAALIDSTCGMALVAHLGSDEQIATLDLRVDYLRIARADAPLFCRAQCHRLTRSVAFIRAVAYQDDANNPVATSVASFMRLTAAAP